MLRFDEITSCGFSKLRIEIGYMGLKHFVWPLGKLYFILDEPTKRDMDLVASFGSAWSIRGSARP